MRSSKQSLIRIKPLPLVCGLLIVAAALAACAPASTASLPTTVPQPTESPSSAATPQLTAFPLPTQTPAAALVPLTLSSIQMLDANTGWATGWTTTDHPSDYHLPFGDIYRTTDGGQRWQAVTPNGAAPESIESVYFLDADHAWVDVSTSGTNPPAVTIYSTTDGGQTWNSAALTLPPDAESGGPLDFVDAQHGWLMANLSIGAGSQAVAIYKTIDGGLSWQEVSQTSEAPGTLPRSCIKTGLTFVDANTGWVTASCPGGPLYFYVTHDGGSQWQPQTLTPPVGYDAKLFEQCQCVPGQPLFTSAQVGFMPLQIFEAQPGNYLYVTRDGGASWNPVKLPLDQLVRAIDFADDLNGWISDGQRLIVTPDSAQTWLTLPPLPGEELQGNQGWMIIGVRLYSTQTGGQTWTAATPLLSRTDSAAQSGSGQPAMAPDVTLDSNGQTLQLQVGQRFLVHLGTDYNWDVSVDNEAVVSRVINIAVVNGAQGVYEAKAAGQATLTATGDPACRQAQPPCGQPSRVIEVKIIVQ
jgi:photosystem II stability/assembly factor-like uncharacterized protein